MSRDLLTLGLGVAAILLTTQAGRAEPAACAERGQIVAGLAEIYGERPYAIGLAARNQLVEVFAAPETGSWTIIMTTPDGIACLIAAGEHFERSDPDAVAPGDPA
jgi:hypothetical protein